MVNPTHSSVPIEQYKFHHAMWIHGTSGQLDWEPSLPNIGFKERLDMLAEGHFLVNRIGIGIRIEMTGSQSGNYVIHFPMPTQNMIGNNTRLHLQSVMLDFSSTVVVVGKVTVRDGSQTIATFNSLNLSGDHPLEVLELEGPPRIDKGVNISVTLEGALGGIGTVLFRAVGFNLATQTGVIGADLGG
jgi:hypothetical protein